MLRRDASEFDGLVAAAAWMGEWSWEGVQVAGDVGS